MSLFHLLCLLLGLSSVHVADGKRRRRTLSGESGNLEPDEDDDDSYVYNTEKLIIFFDDDCVTSEDEATDAFTSLISDFGDCLYGNSTIGLFEDVINTGSWHGYFDVYFDNIDCLSDISMNYDDYCIESFNYEEIFNLDAGCRSDASYIYLHNERTNLWHLDQIDGTKNSYYNYYSYDDNSGIDIYILDTGIRTTHQEFDGINVGNHDWGYDNDEVDQSHGTHVAGIAAGKKVGVHRGAKNIYSFAVCRSAFWGCFEQDIEAGLKMVDRALQKRPTKYRRAVINMSWGGKSESDRGHLNSYIQSIYNSGGIMVAAAGNSAEDACSHWPSSLEWVIAVGAYSADYEVAWFSNYGSCVDIYAPGQDVLSSIIDCDHCYAFYNGTSMASPAMAGMIANWLSMDQELTFSQIKSKIATTSYSKTLSQCPSGSCRGIEMSCNEYYSFYDSSNDISSTNTPNSCNTESYSCAVLSNVPETLGVDINGVYTNTGQCYNSRPVYKATNIEDIGDLYLFYDGSWFVNYLLCKSSEDDCKVYLYGRSSFSATSSGANYYSYTDYTFSDDRWTVHYTSSISLTGSDSSSTCYVSSSRSSNSDTDTITSDDDDDDIVYGVEGESVSFAAISQDSTSTDGSDRSSTDNDNDDVDEWWPWLIVALFGASLIVLVAVIVYYQQKIKALQNQPSDGANYHLMAGK